MQPVKFFSALVVLFVWSYLYETFISPAVSGSTMSQIPGIVESPPMMWIIIGSLVAYAVLLWVYEKVQGVFGAGVGGGVKFGFYTAVLMNFPLWLFFTLYVGWPYKAMWHFTLVSIVLGVINGALIGLVYEKVGRPKAA